MSRSTATAIRHRAAAGALLLLLALATAEPAGATVAAASSIVTDFVEMPGYTLFELRNEVTLGGTQLWRTDGTPEGTSRVAPVPAFPLWFDTRLLGRDGEVAYLAVTAQNSGTQLWRTDGTPAGTLRLTDLPANRAVAAVDGEGWAGSLDRLFFFASTPGGSNLEAWTSDGTVAGTRPLGVTLPTGGDGVVSQLVELPGAMLVLSTHHLTGIPEVWRSNGEPGGTLLLGGAALAGEQISRLVRLGDRVAWFSTDGCTVSVHSTDGASLPPPVAAIDDTACRNVDFLSPVVYRGLAYAGIYDDTHDQELWATDGTSGGTVRLTDHEAERPLTVSPFFALVPVGEEVWFPFGPASDVEPWRTDGTPEGTAQVADLCPGDCASNPYGFTAFGGAVWFVTFDAETGHSTLWERDGTVVGPLSLATWQPPPPFVRDAVTLVPLGNQLLLLGDLGDGAGDEIFRFAGPGLMRLTDFPFPQLFATPSTVIETAAGARFLFAANDGVHGNELWVSDGTAAGTHLFRELSPVGTATAPPPPPLGLETRAVGDSRVALFWSLADDNYPFVVEGLARIERRSPFHDWLPVAAVDHFLGSALVEGLLPGIPYTFRVRLENAAGFGAYSDPASITLLAADLAAACTPDAETLCFEDGRFAVSVAWRDQHNGGQNGTGRAIAGEGRSGYFWFFREDNVELIVKILDGTAINGEHWVFYGALSDVEYWVTVVDHEVGRARTYRNPPGEVCGRGDTRPFEGIEGTVIETAPVRLGSDPPLRTLVFDAAPAGLEAATAAAHPFVPCVPDDETLCLGDGGRFQVRVTWQDQHNGGSGVGHALPFTDRSGFFWFFRQDNVELVVKVLDGTAINGKHWFFYGALSDVGYEIEVLDTADGHAVRQYVNEPGNLCGGADTAAF